MPMVGTKKFAYTEKGKKEAKEYAKKTGNAAKRARIKAGSGEKMRKVGTKGAPTAKAFKQAAKTAKKK